MNRLAQELGWEPQQVQAAIWVAMKARMENSGVKKRTEASSEKNGWIRFDYPLKNGKPTKTRVILDAQKHRDNWLKHAMEHEPTKDDTEQAKFDFSDGVRRHIGQISWEARPGRSTNVLPGVNDAPYEQQVEFQQAVQKALLDDDGIDLLAYKLGLLVDGPDILAPGVWQGEVAAGMQKLVAMAPSKGGEAVIYDSQQLKQITEEEANAIDPQWRDGWRIRETLVEPTQLRAIDTYAATLGLLLRQEGVGYHRPFYNGTKAAANGVAIDIGRTLTQQEAQALWGAIDQRMKDAGAPNWENAAGMISSPTGIRVVNFGALSDNGKFQALVKSAAQTLPVEQAKVVTFSSDGALITNDWKESPNGEDYRRRIGAAGSPDLLRWVGDVLAPRVQAVFNEFSSRYGWGDPGSIQFSNRTGSDAAGGGRARGVGPEELSQAVTPSYGTPREGASSALGYHYSQQPRTVLASSMYGSGLKGAEMARLQGADPRLMQRVYFYLDRGTGISPEAGVGGYGHRVNLQNLYDVDEDALRLRRSAPSYTAFESAVIDAGFDGYMTRNAGPSGQAILLGQHSVPVEQLGSLGRTQSPSVLSPAQERTLNDAEKISANKLLPSGQMSGREWARSISRGMPDVYARLADSPVWESDTPMYRDELAKALEREAQPMFSNGLRRFPRVIPRAMQESLIEAGQKNLQRAVAALRNGRSPTAVTIGRLPHVLNMLGAPSKDFAIASSIVKKVFIDKHADEFKGVSIPKFVRSLYEPAMIFKSKDGENNVYELVLNMTNDKGALLVPVVVPANSGENAAVMSSYFRTVSTNGSAPGERGGMSIARRIYDGNLVYADWLLAKQALTGRALGAPGFQEGGRLNGSFVAWRDIGPVIHKLIADRRVKSDINVLAWIGDNYKPSSSPEGWADVPMFANRMQTATPEFKAWFGDSKVVDENGEREFDPANPDITASNRRVPIIGRSMTLPATGNMDAGRIKLQDDALRMKRVIEAVKAQGGTVTERQNFYDANTLMPGRIQAAVDDFRTNVVLPMLDKASRYGIDMDELALYAYAKHAEERNDYIAKINPRMPDGGSGMKTADANALLQQVAQSGKQAEYDDLHQDLMSITSTTRQLLLNEGLITQDEFDAMTNAYQHYIPLRGWENVVEETGVARPGVGRGVNVRGKETVRALGRSSRAGGLIENALRDYERVVSRIEKNDVGKVLLDFVLSNPDPDLWGVNVVKRKPAFNKAQGIVQFTSSVETGENTIGVKVGGEQVYIEIADPELARALRQAWKDETSGLERATLAITGWWNNWLRATLTKYNPAFAAINIPRDALWSGTASALAELGPKGLASYLKNYPRALLAASRKEAGIPGSSATAALYEQFRAAGGITGGFHMRSVEDIRKDLQRDLRMVGPRSRTYPLKAARFVLKALEFLGSASENATRFSLYAAAREVGRSPAQAAILAKDGTTNFNRKGEWGGALNNLYLFFNAGVQGTTQLAKVLRSPAVQASMAGVAGVGAMLALYGASAGGEDDDGEAYWDKLPAYIKERNLVIMLPPGEPLGDGIERVGKRGRYITIPVQYGFNIFPNLGYMVADTWRHSQDPARGVSPTKAAVHMASVVFGSVNPFGGSVDVTDGVQVLLAAMPTLADLPVQIATERNTFGAPSSPSKNAFDTRPDSERMFTSMQGTAAQKIAERLNALGGGNEAKAGKIMGVETSIAPGTIKTFIGATTGGLGTFVDQMADSIIAMSSDDQNLRAKSMPVLNRFYGEVDEDASIRSAAERRRQVDELVQEVKRQRKVGLEPELDAEANRLIDLAGLQEQQQKLLTRLRKEEIEVVRGDMPEAEKKAERKRIQAERDRLAIEFNREFLQGMRQP